MKSVTATSIAVALLGLLAALAACTAEPAPAGVVLPLPESGKQYRMSEVCAHLQAEGYDVRATLDYTVEAEDLGGLLEALPGLVRGPVESYIADGLLLTLEIRDLCAILNTDP